MTIKPILLAMPLLLLALTACTRIATPEGWAGGVVDGETLYIGTRDGYTNADDIRHDIRAINTQSGETRWGFNLLSQDESMHGVYGSPALQDDILYVGGYDGVLYAIDTNEGTDIWNRRLSQEDDVAHIVGSPTIAGNAVLLGADNGKIYALDKQDNGTELWTFQTDNKVWSSPIAANGVVYATSLDNTLYALNAEDGSLLWKFSTKGAIASTPAYSDGVVYVGSFDSVFYAVNASDGALIWQFNGADGWYWGTPIVNEENVYAPSLDGNLYALDKRTGNLQWTIATEGPIVGSPVIVFDMIAVGSDDGKLHIARTRDGNPVDSCNIRTEIRSSLTALDRVVFFAANDKSIRALRIKTNGNPDEEWVHQPDEENSVARGRLEDC